MESNERHIVVSCAIITNSRGDILAAQRSEKMSQPLCWEFPGGKIEHGETAEACLHREIMEELQIEIDILDALPPVKHCYDLFHIELHPFVSCICKGTIKPTEHKAVVFGQPENLRKLPWATADIRVLESYISYLEKMGV